MQTAARTTEPECTEIKQTICPVCGGSVDKMASVITLFIEDVPVDVHRTWADMTSTLGHTTICYNCSIDKGLVWKAAALILHGVRDEQAQDAEEVQEMREAD